MLSWIQFVHQKTQTQTEYYVYINNVFLKITKKMIDVKFNQKQTAKEIGVSDSANERYGKDMSMDRP